jgi:mono/diheme cytochrome c family protein
MKKSIWLSLGLIVIFALVLSACAAAATPAAEKAEAGGGDVAVPVEYAGKTNPLEKNANAVSAGKAVYEANCLSCHGESGKGDGPAGASLNPKPGNLVEVAADDSVDRIFWRISEGGMQAPFNSAMAAWKGVLSEDERWQVISYIKTLK